MNIIPLYDLDRSRIVAREECERKRFLNYDFDVYGEPIGLQRKTASLPLLNGIEIHEAAARILGGERLNDVMELMNSRYRGQVDARGVHAHPDVDRLIAEQTHMLEGMLRAFALTWVPRILEEYDVVSIEQPLTWGIAPSLRMRFRFDVVLRRKGDGQLVILDYKSMAYVSDAWSRKLERSRQTHLYIAAAQELYGEKVEMAYVGMVKGIYGMETAKSSPFYQTKIQKSPYLYAYALRGSVGNVYQTEYTNKKGYQKFRTYDEMPMAEWIDWLWKNERETLNNLFTFNPPFAPTQGELDRVKALVIHEELEYLSNITEYRRLLEVAQRSGEPEDFRIAREFLDLTAAPMRDEACVMYGLEHTCQFYGLCHTEGALDTVLEDEEFEKREVHHEITEAA
jgi:hypothetical protein